MYISFDLATMIEGIEHQPLGLLLSSLSQNGQFILTYNNSKFECGDFCYNLTYFRYKSCTIIGESNDIFHIIQHISQHVFAIPITSPFVDDNLISGVKSIISLPDREFTLPDANFDRSNIIIRYENNATCTGTLVCKSCSLIGIPKFRISPITVNVEIFGNSKRYKLSDIYDVSRLRVVKILYNDSFKIIKLTGCNIIIILLRTFHDDVKYLKRIMKKYNVLAICADTYHQPLLNKHHHLYRKDLTTQTIIDAYRDRSAYPELYDAYYSMIYTKRAQ